MKTVSTMLLLATVAGVAFMDPVGANAPGHGPTGANTGVAPSHGPRWGTDPALRTGMSVIREALVAKLPGIRAGTLQPGEYRALGATIAARVRTILAECTLAPAADADLHPIVAALIVAADAMQGPQATAAAAGARDAVSAVNRYGQVFDDPGWLPLGSD
jgi:hypothetical protein